MDSAHPAFEQLGSWWFNTMQRPYPVTPCSIELIAIWAVQF